MKKKISKILSLVIMTGLLIVSLSACGGSKNASNVTSNEPISPSEIFNQEGIWFGSEDMVTKDEEIDYILVFDGKGNVTRYNTTSWGIDVSQDLKCITYSDLEGLSNEEIIELAKERDKFIFEEEIKYEISLGDTIIEDCRREVNDVDNSPENKELYQDRLDANLELLSRMEELPYQEPKAYPFTLEIETDGTGNHTSKEILRYSYLWFDFTRTGQHFGERLTMEEINQTNFYDEQESELSLYPGLENMTVYDMQFNGFSGLYLLVEEGLPIFVLDSPDAEGVKVD